MLCIPLSNYETNFLTASRRHYEKGESYYFPSQLPLAAEADGGIQVYSVKNVQ